VAQIHLVELSNGFACHTPRRADTGPFSELELIYSEIFTHRCYVRPAMRLGDRPFVVDVGGNVGLFSLFAAAEWPAARVLAFEPIPCLGEAFRRNVALHHASGVTVLPIGLGSVAQRGVTFTYYPILPGSSTRYPEQKKPHRELLAKAMGSAVAEYAYTGERFSADVERLSDVLTRYRPTGPVDLLKIDTEGAELDILRGIDDGDWPRVRNVVLELHDMGGRLREVVDLLSARGFTVGHELNTDLPDGFETYLVWAVRDQTGTDAVVFEPDSWPDR
jgi:FkbM family methyltransferase